MERCTTSPRSWFIFECDAEAISAKNYINNKYQATTPDQIKEAFKIVCSDPKVNVILVNIFGGIMRCDFIARGLCEILKELELEQASKQGDQKTSHPARSLPRSIVVRLSGTNEDLGAKMLQECAGLSTTIKMARDMESAARLACEAI